MGKRLVWLLMGYGIIHATIFTSYPAVVQANDLSNLLSVLQWGIPQVIMCLLIVTTWFKLPEVRIGFWYAIGLAFCAACIVLQFMGVPGLWWAWTTLAFLTLASLAVTSLTRETIGNNRAILLGWLAVFAAIAVFEVIYQTGALLYYDFFGCQHSNYVVVLLEQALWIYPLIIGVKTLQKHYGRIISLNKFAALCLLIASVCGAVWFAAGFDIPLIWHGDTAIANADARASIIIISRLAQVFIVLGTILMFRRSIGRESLSYRRLWFSRA